MLHSLILSMVLGSLPASAMSFDIKLSGFCVKALAFVRAAGELKEPLGWSSHQDIKKLISDFKKAPQEQRRDLIDAMLVSLRKYSIQSKIKMKAAQAKGQSTKYHIIVVGAGAHAAAFNLALSGSGLKILTIEKSQYISNGVFGTSGKAFRVNTKAPFNQFYKSPIQIDEITTDTYANAEDLGRAIIAAQAASQSDLIFGSAVTRVMDGESYEASFWPGRYKVITSDGFSIFADAVVLATGLGHSKNTEALKKTTNAYDYEQHVVLINAAYRKEESALKQFAGLTVAVGGGGDSANIVVENLLGKGTTEIYGGVPPTQYQIAQLLWLGQKSKTYEEFKKANNERYHENFEDVFKPRDDVDLSSERVIGHENIINERGEKKVRVYVAASNGGEEVGFHDVDIYFDVTGYKDNILEIFKDFSPALSPGMAEIEFKSIAGIPFGEIDESYIGRQLHLSGSAHSIFSIGATAALDGPLVMDQEFKFLVAKNPVTLGWLVPKTITMAEIVRATSKKPYRTR